jgi:hypothetical protein
VGSTPDKAEFADGAPTGRINCEGEPRTANPREAAQPVAASGARDPLDRLMVSLFNAVRLPDPGVKERELRSRGLRRAARWKAASASFSLTHPHSGITLHYPSGGRIGIDRKRPLDQFKSKLPFAPRVGKCHARRPQNSRVAVVELDGSPRIFERAKFMLQSPLSPLRCLERAQNVPNPSSAPLLGPNDGERLSGVFLADQACRPARKDRARPGLARACITGRRRSNQRASHSFNFKARLPERLSLGRP